MRYLLSTTIAAGLLLAGGAALAAQTTVMRVSHQLPPRHHIAKLVEQWAADVEKRSGGEIDVQVFPANQAFKPKENFPAVARGKIEAAMSVNFQWGKTIPEMNITLKPYSFTDLDLLKKFAASPVASYLEKRLLEKGVRNVAWLFTTRMSAYTSKGRALIKPADFKGVKIRGLNKLVDSGLRALGAAPSAMSGSQVYQALQTGVIDAGLTDISAAYSRKYYEVQDYVTVSPLFSVFFHLYVNPKWWDGLDKASQDAIRAASATAEQQAIAVTEASAAEAPGLLAAKGMTVHIHTPAEIAAMKKVMDPPFTKAFIEATGENGKKLLDIISRM
jgi:TRAP-type C4-dicarboxylate transport system substrate-binding protein